MEEASQALRKAIALDPKDYLNCVKLASILNQQGKPHEAITYYQKAIALNPRDVMVLYSLGGMYEQTGQIQRAEEAYTLALRSKPEYRFALLSLARTESQQKKYAAAADHLRQFLAAYPDHFEAGRRLGQLYLVMGRPADAVQVYENLQRRFPGQFTDHVDMARALNGANEPEKALAALQVAYFRDGNKADINEEMARAHAALGQGDLAIIHFQRAYALNPAKDSLLLNVAALQRARKDWPAAIDTYQTFLNAHPEDLATHRALADTLLDNRQYEVAMSELTALAQQAGPPQADQPPVNPALYYSAQKDIAYATQMLGDLPRATALYEALLPLPEAQNDLQLHSNLALAYHQASAYDKAVALYKSVYYAPDAQLAEAGLQRETVGHDLAAALTALGDAAYHR